MSYQTYLDNLPKPQHPMCRCCLNEWSEAMEIGYYWFRKEARSQLHILLVDNAVNDSQLVVKDLTGFLPRVRGPRRPSDLKGTWWKIEEPITEAS